MRKIAIVTGCSRGIGREIVLELARDGYDVIGTYNESLDDIKTLDSKIKNIGVNFYYQRLNLLDDNSINDFCNYIKSNFNSIDLLVNNAGLSLDNEFNIPRVVTIYVAPPPA